MRRPRGVEVAGCLSAVLMVIMLSAADCGGGGGGSGDQTGQQQASLQTSLADAGRQMDASVPYPKEAMINSSERANARRRLLNFNDPNKVWFFYGMNTLNQVNFFTTVKGKVSSTATQMTPDQVIVPCGRNNDNACVINGRGDDGTWAGEECSQYGVFGYTPSGRQFEWCSPNWTLTETPITLASPPLLTYESNAAATAAGAPGAPPKP